MTESPDWRAVCTTRRALMSSASMTTASPPASLATARLRPSRTEAMTWCGRFLKAGPRLMRQQGLQHVRVGVLDRGPLRREHHDRAGRVEVDHFQVGEVERAAGAAHHPGVAGGAEPVAQPILHHHLVLLGQDHDGGAPTALVRLDQLGRRP